MLASVNGSPITRGQFETQFRNLPEKSRKHFENDRVGLLEELITRELLFQEAVRTGITENSQQSVGSPEEQKLQLVRAFVEKELQTVVVMEKELKDYYNDHRNQFARGFEGARSQITNLVLQRKREEKYDALVTELRSRATINRNEKWIKNNTPLNPLDRVLGKGRPVLADFGRGVCIPCKKMKPILEEVTKEYESRAYVFVIDTDKHRALTRKYRVRLIPTQIFFDGKGNERYRHEGFMPKEEILTRLNELLEE